MLAVYLGIPAFYEQMKEFSKQTPSLTEKYHDLIFNFENQSRKLPFGIHKKLHQLINHYENSMANQADGIGKQFTHLPSLILTITTIPFITYYMLHDHTKIKDFFIGLIPRKWQSSVRALFLELDFSLGGYIRAQLFVCVLIGILSYFAYLLIGMDYPILLSVIVGITNIIPTFGPVFGAVPALLIAFTISKSMVIKVFITNAVLQIIEGNLISPIIMGKNLRLHPLFIMFALIIGEEVGGLSGIIFSVPILAIIKVIITHVKFHFQQKRDKEI
ncbi:MAG: family transporter [Bacillales bacterium]|nr:family transporter [Bacillales bacterium]